MRENNNKHSGISGIFSRNNNINSQKRPDNQTQSDSHAADAEVIDGIEVGAEDVLVVKDLLAERIHAIQCNPDGRRGDEVLQPSFASWEAA